MNYVLQNPPLVYRLQHAGRPTTYRAERTSENSRHQGFNNRYSSGFQIQRNRTGKPTIPNGWSRSSVS
jgi:hypothetical protein